MRQTVTLVVLPGLDGTDVFFRPFLEALPRWIRPLVVCYPADGPNGYEDLLSFVRGQLAGTPDYFVLGSSFSGPLAILLAAAEPERVRGIILSATFLQAPARYLPRLRFAAVGPVFWAFRAARRLPVWLLRRRDDPFRAAKAETWRRVSARCLAARLRAVFGVDVREPWKKCTAPALCLIFAEDRVVPPRCAQEILRHRPAIRQVTVPGDHLAMCKNPAPWAREVVQFVAEQTGRGEGSAPVHREAEKSGRFA